MTESIMAKPILKILNKKAYNTYNKNGNKSKKLVDGSFY